MNKKIIFSGGGTGGHIFPAINLMKHFFDKEYKVILVTDNRGNNFIKNYSEFKSYILRTGTPTNKNLFKKFFSYFLIFYSIVRSILILKKEKPNLIFGFGGYVSFPISFVSRFFNLPLVIYENNMVLGRTNKYLSSFSKKILLAKKIEKNFPEKYIKKEVHNDVYKITKKCDGCMYGSYPEVTITARYLSAFTERLKYFNFKTPSLKKVNAKYLQNLASEILNEQNTCT